MLHWERKEVKYNVNKQEFITAFAKTQHLTIQEADEMVRALFELISSRLEQGEPVQLRGFVTFEVKEYQNRGYRNPRSGKEEPLPTRLHPTFVPSGTLKQRVRTGGEG